jgi:hypothetical protein
MDTVILQSALWKELEECYYPFKKFSRFKTWNVVEPLLEAAAFESMTVFLGALGSVTGWCDDLPEDALRSELNEHLSCFEELLEHGDKFQGFYFSPETAFTGERNRPKEKALIGFFKSIFIGVQKMAPEKKILLSPGTKYFEGKEKDIMDSWSTLLDGVPLDILAPQDSIGTMGNRLCWQKPCYDIWSKVCDDNEIEFWSNIELFERKDSLEGTDYNMTALPERVAAQIATAAPYAKKLICWEAPYYLSGMSDGDGLKLAGYVKELNANAEGKLASNNKRFDKTN